jgi:hypothetical protein
MARGIISLGKLCLRARYLFIHARDLFIYVRELFVHTPDHDLARIALLRVQRGIGGDQLVRSIDCKS